MENNFYIFCCSLKNSSLYDDVDDMLMIMMTTGMKESFSFRCLFCLW